MIVVGDGGVRVHAELVVHAFDSRTEGIERDATANLGSPRRRTVTVHDLVGIARRTTGARRSGRQRSRPEQKARQRAPTRSVQQANRRPTARQMAPKLQRAERPEAAQ